MNIYVESNFVLELALVQEQHDSCEAILDLCNAGKASLVIPAFSIAEPYQTLDGRHRKRRQMKQEFDRVFRELARTSSYSSRLDRFRDMTALLIDSADEEAKRLEGVRAKLQAIAEIIPLDLNVLSAAGSYQTQYDLSPQDALVLASVLTHMERTGATASCFLNRNSRDFDDPSIVAKLADHQCKLLPRFDSGYQFVKKIVDGQQTT